MPTLGRHTVNGAERPLFWDNGCWMNCEKADKEAVKFRNKTRIESEMLKSRSYLFKFLPASSHFTLKSTSWDGIWGHPFLSDEGGESSEVVLSLLKVICPLTESGQRGVRPLAFLPRKSSYFITVLSCLPKRILLQRMSTRQNVLTGGKGTWWEHRVALGMWSWRFRKEIHKLMMGREQHWFMWGPVRAFSVFSWAFDCPFPHFLGGGTCLHFPDEGNHRWERETCPYCKGKSWLDKGKREELSSKGNSVCKTL